MQSIICKTVLLVSVCLVSAWSVQSQEVKRVSAKTAGTLDGAVLYTAVRGSATTSHNFWMQGGTVQIHDRLWRNLGAVAEISGLETGNIAGGGVGLNLITATFGGRYTQEISRPHLQLDGQALVGVARGSDSLFPGEKSAETSAASAAFNLGAGITLPLNHRFGVRLIDVAWVRTGLPNGQSNFQNYMRLGSGLVVRF